MARDDSKFIPPGSETPFSGLIMTTLDRMNLFSTKPGVRIGNGGAAIKSHLSCVLADLKPGTVRNGATVESWGRIGRYSDFWICWPR